MSSQGRTAQVVGPFEVDGRSFFFKKNPSKEITDIEERVYAALTHDSVLSMQGAAFPYVERVAENVLAIENCGPSLAYRLHFMSEREGTPNLLHSLFGSRETTFEELLQQTIRTNGRINDLITQTLSEEEKQFLNEQQTKTILQRAKKTSSSSEITEEDVQKHFWAYRVMNALAFYDADFKETYTHLIGRKIDALLPEFGSFLGDACLRNAVSPDGQTIVPIDFNSIHYGPKQMDDAAIIGLYIFHGPLGTHTTHEKRKKVVEEMRTIQFPHSDPASYFAGFMLSCFHRNIMLAGYRAQEAEELFQEAKKAQEDEKCLKLNVYRAFRTAFDEVEYQHSAAVEAAREYPEFFAQTKEEKEALQRIIDEITARTFVRRIKYISDPFFQRAERMLEFLYYGANS